MSLFLVERRLTPPQTQDPRLVNMMHEAGEDFALLVEGMVNVGGRMTNKLSTLSQKDCQALIRSRQAAVEAS